MGVVADLDCLVDKIRDLYPDFIPDRLLHLANDIRLERYSLGALRLHIPSRLEGKRGVVGKKAGSLADAGHMHAVHDRIQPKNTALCGHYCLYYAYSRCEGMSVQKIVHTMLSPQWIKSCIPILFDIPDIFSEYQCCKKN